MKLPLRNTYHRNNYIPWLLLFVFCCSSFTARQLVSPEIDLAQVRQDMISHGSEFIPEYYIKKKKDGFFSIFYLDSLCLVHLPFKDLASEPMIRSSIVAVYHLSRHQWKFDRIVPYLYEISSVAGSKKLFFSSNEVCQSLSTCKDYYEVSEFTNGEFKPIFSLTGFDRTPYLQQLLSVDNIAEVSKHIGDTVTLLFELKDFKIIEGSLKEFEVKSIVGIFNGLDQNQNLSINKTENVSIRSMDAEFKTK
jgi:hypothetical protein